MPSIQGEIDLYLKEYAKQKKLEDIICHRPLVRPNTKKWHVILLFSGVPVLFFFGAVFSLCLPTAGIVKGLAMILLFLLIIESYIRYCLIRTVKYYQHYAKEETRRRCLCVPSCSEYAIICLRKKFPLTFALVKIRKRLYKTCKGEDYKLDYP